MAFPTHSERTIHLHVFNIFQCVQVGDFAYVHASKANLLHNGRVAVDFGNEARQALQDIIERAAEGLEANLKSCSRQILKLRESISDKEDWMESVQEISDSIKSDVSGVLHDTKMEAIHVITNLPAVARDSATDYFLYAVDLIGDMLAVLIMLLTAVTEKKDVLFKDVWDIGPYVDGTFDPAVAKSMMHIDCLMKLFQFLD